jgi:signal transduction histidine kinase
MSQVVADIARLTEWPGVTVMQACDGGHMLRVAATAGSLVPEIDTQVSCREGVIGRVWASSSPCYEPACNHSDAPVVPGVEGISSAFFTPIKLGEQTQALLAVFGAHSEAFDATDRQLAESLGDALTLAWQNVRLYTTLQEEVLERQRVEDHLWTTVRKTETLYRIGRSLIGPYQFDEILQEVMNTLAGALHAHRTVLIMLDMKTEEIDSFAAGGSGYRRLKRPTFEACMQSLVGDVMRQGVPALFTRSDMEDLGQDVLWGHIDPIGATAVVPLFLHSEPSGVLIAANRPDQPAFSQEDTDMMMAIAGQIVAAIQNAELFQAVREERRRLHALVQSSRDGILLLSEALHILVINKPALKFLALSGSPDTWQHRPLSDALDTIRTYSDEAVDAILTEMERVRSGDGTPGEGEFKIGLRIVHWLDLPVQGETRTMGRLFVLRNVTEERLLEQFREDLTHTMVHDLRNPLTGISSSLKLLQGHAADLLPERYRQILDIAISSSGRMLKLVNAILDISRLESGRMPLDLTAFEVHDLVDEVSMMLSALIEAQDLTYEVRIDDDLPLAWGDKALIERVIQNLIANAVKFTPHEGSVCVEAYAEPDVPDTLWVSVSDTGPGIPSEIREHLFQKFVTGQQEKTGSGLGLAFCRMVMEAHGERIWVSETSEAGTTFTFTLSQASGVLAGDD